MSVEIDLQRRLISALQEKTFREVADGCGMSMNSVHKFARARSRIPLRSAVKIAAYLGCELRVVRRKRKAWQ